MKLIKNNLCINSYAKITVLIISTFFSLSNALADELDDLIVFQSTLKTVYINSYCKPTYENTETAMYVVVGRKFKPVGTFYKNKGHFVELDGLSLTKKRHSFGLVTVHNDRGGVMSKSHRMKITDTINYNKGGQFTIDSVSDDIPDVFIRMAEWNCRMLR